MIKPKHKRDDRIGIWLKHKQTQQVYVIADVFRTNDGFNECGTYTLVTPFKDGYSSQIRVSYDKYHSLFNSYEHCPVAQLLYCNSVGDAK